MPNRYNEMGYWEIVTRQMSIISKNKQQIFKDSKIAVIGCGGIGGAAIEMLARMGVGELNIVDSDYFDMSNLNRQTMSSLKDLNYFKSESTKKNIHNINPYVKVNAFNEFVDENNIEKIVSSCDVIIDGLDNLLTRVIVSRYAKENNIPLIHGAIHGTMGQMTVFSEDTASYEELFSLPSFNKQLDEDLKEEINNISSELPPAIGPVPNVIGCIQAMEAFKLITGIGKITYAPEIFKFDLLFLDSFNVEKIL
ncbi:HesA/MoeB/ThiF family protein [Methanobrevibacter sp. DSM 116169]|uniref:HesA/MoeB/ThiF family protein n=1 Tax=Methanobrevibacter sp. DSM 116169 TaxID=3242727 RepID=UPI0038FC0306